MYLDIRLFFFFCRVLGQRCASVDLVADRVLVDKLDLGRKTDAGDGVLARHLEMTAIAPH